MYQLTLTKKQKQVAMKVLLIKQLNLLFTWYHRESPVNIDTRKTDCFLLPVTYNIINKQTNQEITS